MPCENDIALSWVFFKSIICTRSGEYNGPHRRPCFQLKLIVLTTQSVPQLYPEIVILPPTTIRLVSMDLQLNRHEPDIKTKTKLIYYYYA